MRFPAPEAIHLNSAKETDIVIQVLHCIRRSRPTCSVHSRKQSEKSEYMNYFYYYHLLDARIVCKSYE